MNPNNPAARLLSILEKGLELPDGMNCREAWCELLSVGPEDNAVLMGRIGKVMSLSTEIIERLNNIGDVKIDRYLHWVNPLESAFINNNLNGTWQHFKKSINVHVINYLSMTSDLLSHKLPEPVISRSKLDSMLESTRLLIDEVRSSELPHSTKEFMIKQLHKVCLAIEEYTINGADSVSEAVESAFGYGVLNADVVEAASSSPTAKKFWQNMANIALIISISTGVQQLAPPIMKLLPEINFTEEVVSPEDKKSGSSEPMKSNSIE